MLRLSHGCLGWVVIAETIRVGSDPLWRCVAEHVALDCRHSKVREEETRHKSDDPKDSSVYTVT